MNEPKESTWEKIILEAKGKQKDSDETQAYETARNQIGNYIYEKYGTNVDADYEPDKAIADFLDEHPEADSFDIDGNMNILKNFKEKKEEKVWNLMITEKLTRVVRVKAENYDEAYSKIEDLIFEEKVILSADDFSDRDIEGLSENSLNDETYPVDDDFSEEKEENEKI